MNVNHFIRTNRVASLGIALAAILVGYVFFHGPTASAQTRYVLGTVEKGTLTVSVSATGQIQPTDQIDVKPKTSADITKIAVVAGQKVVAGQVLAYLDAQNSQQAVQNAQIALNNAKITLQKLQRNQITDTTTATGNLDQSYVDALNQTANAFLKLPSIVDTAHGVLYDNTLQGGCSPNSCQYGNLVSDAVHNNLLTALTNAENDYTAARAAYDTAFTDYRVLRDDAPTTQISAMLDETQHVTMLLAQAVKSEKNVLDLVVNDMDVQAAKNNVPAKIPAQLTTYQTSIGTAIGDLNTVNAQLVSTQRAITQNQQTIDNATLTNPLDIASQQNAVAQQQAAFLNAQIDLANHTVRAPIAGTIAKVNVKQGDTASSGTAIATIISPKQLAVVSLNEVDVTKAKLGQKATLTFDAVDGLTLTGVVAAVDSIGTTSQGVVNYNVTIALDTQDARVLPGMSVTTNIITQAVQDALLVPSAAVKTQNGTSFVQTIDNPTADELANIAGFVASTAPRQIEVQVGASNDTTTQILSGLQEGDPIITRTITSTAAAAATATSRTSAGSILGGGGAVRAIGR